MNMTAHCKGFHDIVVYKVDHYLYFLTKFRVKCQYFLNQK